MVDESVADRYLLAMAFTPTNEIERLLTSGVDVASEEFVGALLDAQVYVWVAARASADDESVKLRIAPAKDGGTPAVMAFTSLDAFSFYLKENGFGEEDTAQIIAQDLFVLTGATHDIIFNLGHPVSPVFPAGSLYRVGD